MPHGQREAVIDASLGTEPPKKMTSGLDLVGVAAGQGLLDEVGDQVIGQERCRRRADLAAHPRAIDGARGELGGHAARRPSSGPEGTSRSCTAPQWAVDDIAETAMQLGSHGRLRGWCNPSTFWRDDRAEINPSAEAATPRCPPFGSAPLNRAHPMQLVSQYRCRATLLPTNSLCSIGVTRRLPSGPLGKVCRLKLIPAPVSTSARGSEQHVSDGPDIISAASTQLVTPKTAPWPTERT